MLHLSPESNNSEQVSKAF